MISIPVLLSVYGDELRSGTMQCAIGRGLSRTGIVVGKLIECALLSACSFACLFLFSWFKNFIMDIILTPRQYEMLAVYFLLSWIRLLTCFAIVSMLTLLSWSMVLGILTDLFLIQILEILLKAIQQIAHVAVYDYSFYGLIAGAYASMEVGKTEGQLLASVLIYICGTTMITVLFFNRKELPL